jgi:ribosome-associated heat shock protein Hsp15
VRRRRPGGVGPAARGRAVGHRAGRPRPGGCGAGRWGIWQARGVEQVRVDKWLWAVRLYKTRTAASDACLAGRIEVGGETAKPARWFAPGYEARLPPHPRVRRVRVEVVLERRVGAPVAEAAYAVLEAAPTAAAERAWYETAGVPERDRGSGRPTKRERRETDRLRGGPNRSRG